MARFQKSVAVASIAMWNGRVVIGEVTYEAAVQVGKRIVLMKPGGEVEKRTISVQILKTKLKARPTQGAMITDKRDEGDRVYQIDEIEGDRDLCPVWILRGIERDR